MRRELLRALGEWVHACEEVRSNNMRLEGRARAAHNKRLVAVRKANSAKVCLARQQHSTLTVEKSRRCRGSDPVAKGGEDDLLAASICPQTMKKAT